MYVGPRMFDIGLGLERVTLMKTDSRLRIDGYFVSCKVSLFSNKNRVQHTGISASFAITYPATISIFSRYCLELKLLNDAKNVFNVFFFS